jgi:predicted short-subunit dehydrogenase-like oxidoreductase (DUF2520 family)
MSDGRSIICAYGLEGGSRVSIHPDQHFDGSKQDLSLKDSFEL